MGDNYLVNDYTYLWWPMEDYKNMTWARLTDAITDPQARAALWDIWYDRDYRRYDELTGKTHTLDKWPLRGEYRLYVRRDVVAQMWDLGTIGLVEIGPTDPYAEGWQELTARLVFGSEGAAPGQFQNPRGIEVGPDGFVYVADSGNHRIQKFTADGEFVTAWGQQSAIETEAGVPRGFNEPWDVAVASDGAIYVADTWNHRIQKLDADGDAVTAWGLFGQYSLDEPMGQSAFYGPRGVAVGPDDLVYVTDTGNKRVQVFEADGRFAFQWGGGGALEGYLDEPVGIAIGGPDDEVYIADTWNRRVQVFDSDGNFLRQWPISGWDAGLPEEKPYLAVDAEGRVYVTDPGHYRTSRPLLSPRASPPVRTVPSM
jgi:DNA-binding beta-propeller fold protein YncE